MGLALLFFFPQVIMSALKPIHCFVFLPMLYSEVLLSSDQGFPLSLDKADSKNEGVSGTGLSNSFFVPGLAISTGDFLLSCPP